MHGYTKKCEGCEGIMKLARPTICKFVWWCGDCNYQRYFKARYINNEIKHCKLNGVNK